MKDQAQRPRRWARIAAFNLATLVLGIAVVELVFGDWLPGAERMHRLRIPRNERTVFDVGDLYPTPRRLIRYTRDAHGFRGLYVSPADIDVLTLGGSTTDQRYISDGETWQDVLAAEFRAGGQTVSVVNAGVDGQSTYGHIKAFDWWFPEIPGLRVKYFLFYLGVNDFYKDADFRYDRLVQPWSLRSLLEERSILYDLFRTQRGIREARIYRIPHYATHLSECELTGRACVRDHEALMRGRLEAYRERLRMLVGKVRALGAQAILVTQPTRRAKRVNGVVMGDASTTRYDRVEINGVDHYHMMRILNEATLAAAAELRCVAADPAGDVEWADEDFYDFYHNTPRGARKLGAYLYTRLKDLDFAAPRPAPEPE